MFRTLGTPLTHLYEKVMKIIFYASLIPIHTAVYVK